MRYVFSVLQLLALLPVAAAQDNEAEKLFRDMEKKILAAKSFEVTFDLQLEKKKTKGSLLLTHDGEAWARLSGNFGRGGHIRRSSWFPMASGS